MPVIIDISPELIEEVYNEWSKETGRRPTDMTPKEFADRMMVKVKAAAKVVSQDEFDAACSEKH